MKTLVQLVTVRNGMLSQDHNKVGLEWKDEEERDEQGLRAIVKAEDSSYDHKWTFHF